MDWHSDFSEFLRHQLELRTKKNPRFSLRSYAKRLEISASTLSAILNQKGRWKLSEARALELLEKSGASQREFNRMAVKMRVVPTFQRGSVPEKSYTMMTDPWFVPILVCLDLPALERTVPAIAKRFGISETKVNSTLKDMTKQGFVQKSTEGILSRAETAIQTSDNITNESLHRFHENQLVAAGRALENIPTNERDFTSVTFLGDATKLEILKKEIREFQKRLIVIGESESSGEIFTLNVSLFPLKGKSK